MTDGAGGASGAGAAIFSAVGTANSGSGDAEFEFIFDLSTTIPSRIVTVAADNRVAVITRIRETATWRS
jgi:hypothetical protein